MEEANKTNTSLILYMLPAEMLEKILSFLNYKEICQAKLISRRWKEIIDNGNVLKKAAGKTFSIYNKNVIISLISSKVFYVVIFRKNFWHNCCWRL